MAFRGGFTPKQSATNYIKAFPKDLNKYFDSLREKMPNDPYWWRQCFKLDFSDPSCSKETAECLWPNIAFTAADGKIGILLINFLNEIIGNSVTPLSEADVAEAQSKIKNQDIKLEPRKSRDVALYIRKYLGKVTADKGEVHIEHPENQSDLYHVLRTVDEAYNTIITDATSIGEAIKYLISVNKANNDNPEWVSYIQQKVEKGAIVSVEVLKLIKTKFPKPEDQSSIVHNMIAVKNLTKFCISKTVMGDKTKTPGAPIINPFVTIKIKCDKQTGAIKPKISDKTTMQKIDGKFAISPLTDEDGTPINAENAHKLLTYGSIIDGQISCYGLCCSGMGISMNTRLLSLNVERRTYDEQNGLDDLYGNIDDIGEYGTTTEFHFGGPAAAAAPAPPPDVEIGNIVI